ncbi:Rieske 2Fe-2S domain-containing protein [uncultured Sphingomonas sp.]|uniref:Rieske 2Fe-2S domain-containing protein n=1 Tax=uncultured Sphingomonas sp. TaxID=158754 RepID=UPI0026097BCF|nr:Rieske 2Fe-2S domain-containing protein [uncultured Sphingomonas sp.]
MDEQVIEAQRGYDALPLPFGWFAVAMSDEIAPGTLKTCKYFGTEVVVWRGEDGVLNAVDPYCPHLGAHLGLGEVIGNDIRCPFHHWSFNGEGGVTDIPYSDSIPLKLKRGCLPTWPIEESLGIVYVWYHPRRAAPKWDVATADEITQEGWVCAEKHDWVVKTHVQEITENGQDYAHFRAVHGTSGPPATEFKMEGWARRNVVVSEMTTPRGPMTGKIDTWAQGPGQSITRFTDITQVTMMQQITAVDGHTTHVRWQLYHPPGISEGKMRVTVARMRDLVKQVNQDIPIWETKRFQLHPLLVKNDGPILAYRRAYQRFYQFEDDEPTLVAAE